MVIEEVSFPRAGYRAIGSTVETLEKAIERLRRDGHLGHARCIVSRNRRGRYCAHVSRSNPGNLLRGPRSSRYGRQIGTPKYKVVHCAPEHAWLGVPGGDIEAAREIVSGGQSA